MARVFLGLGSNQGDSAATIRAAFDCLSEDLLTSAELSRLYRTRPLYVENQADFINAAAAGDTSLSPHELLKAVNRIESLFGRDRSAEIPKGPRPLDIDILLYGDCRIEEPDLVIPHPRITERRFVLVPLLELDPQLCDLRSGVLYSEILSSLPEQGIYLLE
jgi:2-amino-4-hydroxy-6-hydroxymethyldihydropteridine diphosphokinase